MELPSLPDRVESWWPQPTGHSPSLRAPVAPASVPQNNHAEQQGETQPVQFLVAESCQFKKKYTKENEKGPWQLKSPSLLISNSRGPPVLPPSSATGTSPPLCGASPGIPPRRGTVPARQSLVPPGEESWGIRVCCKPGVTLAALEVKVGFGLSAVKPNTRRSSASSPLLQLISFQPPVPGLMMRHRFGQGEAAAAAAFQQRTHKSPVVVAAVRPPGQVPARRVWHVWDRVTRSARRQRE